MEASQKDIKDKRKETETIYRQKEGMAEIKLEYTPTWIVAIVCTVIVSISLIFEWLLHKLGESLKKSKNLLLNALQKVKDELMILGFISLLLTVFQGLLQRICVHEELMRHWLPCNKDFQESSLDEGAQSTYCSSKGKVPVLSLEAIHQLHIFIFVLAVTHVVLIKINIVLGTLQMNKWRSWEKWVVEELDKKESTHATIRRLVTDVRGDELIQNHYHGFSKIDEAMDWLHAFFKQFLGSINKQEYIGLRLGFIMKHCGNNQRFDFFAFMMRSLQVDFKEVVGISWYLWVFVMILLLLDVAGWHVYFWISIIPLALLLLVGAKLQHVIKEMAYAVASKHTAMIVELGSIALEPSDELFWYNRPKIIFFFLHFILFESAFQIAYFFWILTTYGIDSCIMGRKGFLIPRFILSVIITALCSYSTIPLYAIISRMSGKTDILVFRETTQGAILGWINDSKHPKNKDAGATGEDTNGAGKTEEEPEIRENESTTKLSNVEGSSKLKWPSVEEIQLAIGP